MQQSPIFEKPRLPEIVRKQRQSREWSLDRLASESGVSRASLSRIENGSVSPTTDVLAALAAAFGMTASRLLSLTEDSYVACQPYATQTETEESDTGVTHRAVSPAATGLSAEIQERHLPPGTAVDVQATLPGRREHHLVMLDGALSVTLESDVLDLTAGDCLRFHLSGPLRMQTSPNRGARFLLVRV